jgi:N-acetylglutamate synthase-like GNAT family acetyltransferase
MEIRYASESDVPAIVDLLKVSLGESLLPKSIRYWQWKHIENPFGKSPVLLSLDGTRVTGVRAFMRWTWMMGNRNFEAVRAVDTATHPDYQGKGIFKKLTLRLLQDCEHESINFVFNTPNSSSKPGYLKMGWEEAGKLPIDVKLIRPFGMLMNLTHMRGVTQNAASGESVLKYLEHPSLPELLLSATQSNQGSLATRHTLQSLRWRYHDVPVVKYYAGGITSGNTILGVFFYRIKPSKTGNELRVTDLYLESEKFAGDLNDVLLEKASVHQAHYITISGCSKKFNLGFLSLKRMAVGPIVTIKNIGDNSLMMLRNFRSWNPTLGDLELF